MAQISESHERYRTRETLCADVAAVLNSSVHWGTKHAVLAEVTWVWSEFEGKYSETLQWSEAAWLLRAGDRKQLVHEHVVPKSVIIRELRKLERIADTEGVRVVLDRLCIGAVITKDEDRQLSQLGFRKRMPVGWEASGDPWARYAAAQIDVRRAVAVVR